MKATYIKWCDALTNHDPWLSLEEAVEWAESAKWINEQVGFIIKETDEYILIAAERNLSLSEPQYGHLTKIPTTWIIERIELKIKK